MIDHFESKKKLEEVELGPLWNDPQYFAKNIHFEQHSYNPDFIKTEEDLLKERKSFLSGSARIFYENPSEIFKDE